MQPKIIPLPFDLTPVWDAAAPRHLPLPLTPLLGREHELAQLSTLLRQPSIRLLTLMRPGKTQGRNESADRLVFTPTRPGAVIDEARSRRLPVR